MTDQPPRQPVAPPPTDITMNEFQRHAKRTRIFTLQSDGDEAHREELARYYLVSGLAAQVGEIANRLKKRLRDGADYDALLAGEIAEKMGHSLWYLAMLADELGIDLGPVAVQNAIFNENRWSFVGDPNPPRPRGFDSDYPATQQLPQRLAAKFETVEVDGLKKTMVYVYPNYPDLSGELEFGDPIDDNSPVEDHYRYHDIYHFAYLAYLGWSPVVRKLLGCKRKDDSDVDRIEDGARARDTEEATTAFLYSYVSGQTYLTTSSNVDTGLLMQICRLVRDLEVRACVAKEWEEAIISATRVLRDLVANGGGWVEVDRPSRRVRYLGLSPSADAGSSK